MMKNTKKTRAETSLQSTIKVLVGVLFILFLTGITSADLFSWDNIKSYNETTKTVTIKDLFGLGEEIAKIHLKTPTNYEVGYGGIFKVAEFEVINYKDYSNAFEKLSLKTSGLIIVG